MQNDKSKLKVHETKSRSILKAVSFRIVEITVTTLLFATQMDSWTAFLFALAAESLCLTLTYIAERVWNRINYGRHIFRGKCGVCQK